MDGMFLIDKPAGVTSFGVVHLVRKLSRIKKVGHAGTLDPFATGLLLVCVGGATRLAGMLTLESKSYDATLHLGATTDTLDIDGEITDRMPVSDDLDASQIEAVLEGFHGSILQTPPMYSAVKVKGRALYKYAREGVEVERKARDVCIHRIELSRVALPEISISVACSKGTYIRVLAADIGQRLGTCAYVKSLRRTSTGPFLIQQAVTLEEFRHHVEQGTLCDVLVPSRLMLPELPEVEVGERDAGRVCHGNTLSWDASAAKSAQMPVGGMIRISHAGVLLALGELKSSTSGEPAFIQPRVVVAANP